MSIRRIVVELLDGLEYKSAPSKTEYSRSIVFGVGNGPGNRCRVAAPPVLPQAHPELHAIVVEREIGAGRPIELSVECREEAAA